MRAARPPAGDHLVSLGDLLLYDGMKVGEGEAELGREPLYVLGAALEHRPISLMGKVSIEDLVHNLKVALVVDLLDVTPEDGFVLRFDRHDLCSLVRMAATEPS